MGAAILHEPGEPGDIYGNSQVLVRNTCVANSASECAHMSFRTFHCGRLATYRPPGPWESRSHLRPGSRVCQSPSPSTNNTICGFSRAAVINITIIINIIIITEPLAHQLSSYRQQPQQKPCAPDMPFSFSMLAFPSCLDPQHLSLEPPPLPCLPPLPPTPVELGSPKPSVCKLFEKDQSM